MTDDLERAAKDFAQRRADEEAGLSEEERQRLIDERGAAARKKHYDDIVAKSFPFIANEMVQISDAYVGYFPAFVEVDRKEGNATSGVEEDFASISFALRQKDSGHDEALLVFRVEPNSFIRAKIRSSVVSSPPNGNSEHLSFGPLSHDWVRKAVAKFLDRHPA